MTKRTAHSRSMHVVMLRLAILCVLIAIPFASLHTPVAFAQASPDEVLLSQGKPASASSSAPGYGPGRANDSNEQTEWLSLESANQTPQSLSTIRTIAVPRFMQHWSTGG
jgi:hypothetical protein